MRYSVALAHAKTYSWFQVDEDGTRYVVLIVSLVEEDILAISALSGPVL